VSSSEGGGPRGASGRLGVALPLGGVGDLRGVGDLCGGGVDAAERLREAWATAAVTGEGDLRLGVDSSCLDSGRLGVGSNSRVRSGLNLLNGDPVTPERSSGDALHTWGVDPQGEPGKAEFIKLSRLLPCTTRSEAVWSGLRPRVASPHIDMASSPVSFNDG